MTVIAKIKKCLLQSKRLLMPVQNFVVRKHFSGINDVEDVMTE
nr:hypothetical protein [uncultured Sneathia sp.]